MPPGPRGLNPHHSIGHAARAVEAYPHYSFGTASRAVGAYPHRSTGTAFLAARAYLHVSTWRCPGRRPCPNLMRALCPRRCLTRVSKENTFSWRRLTLARSTGTASRAARLALHRSRAHRPVRETAPRARARLRLPPASHVRNPRPETRIPTSAYHRRSSSPAVHAP